jgi:hypothetical protein
MVCKQPYSAFKSNTSAFSGRERLAKSVVAFRRRTFRERKWQWFTFLYSRLVHFIPDLATALSRYVERLLCHLRKKAFPFQAELPS